MQIPPPVTYAERQGASIAFQSFGQGDRDMVVITDPPSHLDLVWTDPDYVDVLLRLGTLGRAVMYDRRGTGLSDPLAQAPTLEEEALDLEAVMDAAGCERAILFGYGLSTLEAAYFAATRPDAVERLILFGPFARGWEVEGTRWTATERDELAGRLELALDSWGQGRLLDLISPELVSPRTLRLWGTLERASASRAAARVFWKRAMETDIAAILPSIQAPTLVLGHETIPPTTAVVSEVADLIPDSTMRELGWSAPPTGFDDLWLPLADEMEEFLTGERLGDDVHRRSVTTLLFTDVAGSTELAARHGDTRWREMLARHDEHLRDLVYDHGGRLIKNIGDGSLSSFDGPVGAIRCARALAEAVRPVGLDIRAGVHTGECERVGLDVAGLAVHVGARVEAAAEPGRIMVTRDAAELCSGSGLAFDSRGPHQLKGVPGDWELLVVREDDAPAAPPEPAPELRMGDRVVLRVARRAPGLLRGLARRAR